MPVGNQSRLALAALVDGKEVRVEWYKRARYGRVVGSVYVERTEAGLDLIRARLAWSYRRYPNEQSAKEREDYERAETDVGLGRRGLSLLHAPSMTRILNDRHISYGT